MSRPTIKELQAEIGRLRAQLARGPVFLTPHLVGALALHKCPSFVPVGRYKFPPAPMEIGHDKESRYFILE